MRSVLHLGNHSLFISTICYLLRPLLKRTKDFFRNKEHKRHFYDIEEKIAKTAEKKHFNPELETRIKLRDPTEHFKYYLHSRLFNFIADRRALLPIMREIEQKIF